MRAAGANFLRVSFLIDCWMEEGIKLDGERAALRYIGHRGPEPRRVRGPRGCGYNGTTPNGMHKKSRALSYDGTRLLSALALYQPQHNCAWTLSAPYSLLQPTAAAVVGCCPAHTGTPLSSPAQPLASWFHQHLPNTNPPPTHRRTHTHTHNARALPPLRAARSVHPHRDDRLLLHPRDTMLLPHPLRDQALRLPRPRRARPGAARPAPCVGRAPRGRVGRRARGGVGGRGQGAGACGRRRGG